MTLNISGDSVPDHDDVAPLSIFPPSPGPTRPGKAKSSKRNFGKAKLSEAQIIERMTVYIEELKQADNVVSKENSAKVLFLKTHVAGNTDRTMRTSLINKAVSLGVTTLFQDIWKKLFQLKFESAACRATWRVMKNCLEFLWNCTDSSKVMCEEVLRSELYKYILDVLREPRIVRGNMKNNAVIYTSQGMLGILHNLVQNCKEARIILRAYDAVKIVKEYRTVKSEPLHCNSLLTIAYLIDDNDDENELLISREDLKFILMILTSAVKSADHISREYGFNVAEILQVISLLAGNKSNVAILKEEKSLIGGMQQGPILSTLTLVVLRDHSEYAPSQWESHWLCTYTE